MKKKFQFFLFSLIILISLVFYNSYFKSPTDQRSNDLTEKDETKPVVGKNNVIKNLKYDVKFDDNSKYKIGRYLYPYFEQDGDDEKGAPHDMKIRLYFTPVDKSVHAQLFNL